MKQSIYQIVYSKHINWLLRNANRHVNRILGTSFELPPSGALRVHATGGQPFSMLTNQTNYVTHLIFWRGYQNFEYTKIFVKLLPKINGFYDVGANIGYYSLLAASIRPELQITAFEPSRGPLHYLRANCDINRFQNILVEDLALADVVGEITFYENQSKKYTYVKHNLGGEGNAGSKTNAGQFSTNTVKAITFDAYTKLHQPQHIDLIKIDTEGTEHLILGSAQETLRKYRPIVICETLFNANEGELEQIFAPLDYAFYNEAPNKLVRVESIQRTTDNGIRNCFFVPKEKQHLIAEFTV